MLIILSELFTVLILLKILTINCLSAKNIQFFKEVPHQTIQNIIDCSHISVFDLLLLCSPDHELNTNTQIVEAVCAYTAGTKRFM